MKRFYIFEIYGLQGNKTSIWNRLLEVERKALPTKPNRGHKDPADTRPEGDWKLGYQAYEMLPVKNPFSTSDPFFAELGIFRPKHDQMPIIFCVPDDGGEMEFKEKVTVKDAITFIRKRI